MNDSHGGVDWRNIQDTSVVFEESDRIDPSITDPALRKAIEEAIRKYRRILGLDDDKPNDAKAE